MNPPATALVAVPAAPSSSTRSVDFTIDVALDADALRTSIVDARPEVRSTFSELSPAQQTRLAEDAWQIGLRCVINAHRVTSESRLADVGQQLVGSFEKQLAIHQERQQATLAQVVGEYFDPRTGRVPARIDEFLRDEGELSRTMARFLSPDGELAKVLARAVGENSPFMQRLSPTESQGVVQMFETRLKAALSEGNNQLARALDPAVEGGAIRRFFGQLREEMCKVDDDRGKQLAVVTKALDGSDPSSAMSQLVRDTQAASHGFLRAINGDDPTSALGGIKTALVTLIEAQGKAQLAALDALDARQRQEATATRETLARIEERRRGDARSPRGGTAFEAALGGILRELLSAAPVTLDATGGRVGARSGCKVGDYVVKYTAESIYAGSALVIEAKHDAAYTVSGALEELATARANRLAGVGLFVMSRSHAAAGFPAYARYGQDVLIIWDESDPSSDPVLWCGVSLALALAARHQRPQDPGDIAALRKIEGRIEREVERFEKMRKLADDMRSRAESMLEEIGKGTKGLGLLLRDAKKTLLALNVEIDDAEAMTEEPVVLPKLAPCAAE